MSFIPYHSERGTVDLVYADAKYREALEQHLEKMRRITVRWVPVLQELQARRPEMHWCSYDDGRVVAFCELKHDEAFGDFEDIYNWIASHVRRLERLGNYKGEFVHEPDPKDETDVRWRKWSFIAGDSTFVLNVGFGSSQHCRIVVDGTETVTVEKKRVVCGDTAEDLAA